MSPEILNLRHKAKRKHGLQWPWDPLQILSWLYITYQVTIFYVLVVKDIKAADR
jgi:hypothetical protein